MPSSDTKISDRMARTEATVSALAEDVATLAQTQREFTTQVSGALNSLKDSISSSNASLERSLNATRRTNWPTLGGMFAVIVAIAGYFVNARVGPMESKIETHERELSDVQHRMDDISIEHARTDERMKVTFEFMARSGLLGGKSVQPNP